MWNKKDNRGNIIKLQSKNRIGRMLPITVVQLLGNQSSKFFTRSHHQMWGMFRIITHVPYTTETQYIHRMESFEAEE